MDMNGEQLIAAPRLKVWQALNDPEILRQAIPGCESVEKLSDTEFVAQVTAKVGPVKAKFKGKVALSNLDPPNGYTIQGEGQGGVAGFGKGGARVALEDAADGATLLRYEVEATVGGKLAQIGSRLIDATARKMAEDFFGRFNDLVGAPAEGAADGPEGASEDAAAEDAPLTAGPLSAEVEAELAGVASADHPHPIAPTQAPATVTARSLPPWIWVGGLVVLAIVIGLLYAARG